MLIAREAGGYTTRAFVTSNFKSYLRLLLATALVLLYLAFVRFWMLFALVAGMVSGAILRDMGWLQGSRKTWSFVEKVTDWEKVGAIAKIDDAKIDDDSAR